METTYFGNATPWYHGPPPGPWIMTDQENNLVGCVTTDGTKNCNLPIIMWRFVTAMAKGEPHHWTTLGGDSQTGDLKVMFDGPRVDRNYDPMRKQGAILLGNGGDNSNGSQGTFYEGAMTKGGTFPSNETDQKVQANVVAAKYDVQRLSVAPASATATPPGLQTFSPGSSQETTVTLTNTTRVPAIGVKLSITVPMGWTSVVSGGTATSKTFTDPVAPGAGVSATFKVTPGRTGFNGDLVGNASWMNQTTGRTQTETAAEKVRNVSPIKINEFAVNSTDSFIELYNASSSDVDLSGWTLTEHPAAQPVFSSVKVPAGTKLAAKGFYVFGLANSGLTVPAHKGDSTLYVRSITGMNAGDTIQIDTGSAVETRKIASLGTAAGATTTLWQPLPDGPVITIPPHSTNVPYAGGGGGFAVAVGQKLGLGYGSTYPAVARDVESYEVVTVTEVGKQGKQTRLAAGAYLAMLLASLFIGPATEAPVRRLVWRAMLVLVGADAGSAVWFTIVQKWIIGAFCPYCMATHITGLLLAALVIWRAPRQFDDESTDVAGRNPAPRRVIGPLPAMGLALVGVALAGIMAACQAGFTPPAVYRGGQSEDKLPAIDPRAVPLVGSPDADYVVNLLFDYKCPHCQQMHFMLGEVVRRYRGRLAFALCPAPLNTNCNPYVPRNVDEFKDSCELAKVGLAVWVAKREAFPVFDGWMYSLESGDRWQPRSLDAAKAKAVELVGKARFDAALADPWVSRYMQTSIQIYGHTIQNGNNAVPKLVFGSHWVIPEPNDADELVFILHESLGVPSP
jgi:hypothetical protein